MALPHHFSGDFLPIIKYDARAGKFIRVDRSPTPDGHWTSNPVEMPLPVVFLADFSSLEIGWMCFKDNIPDMQLAPWPLEDQLAGIEPKIPEQPTVDHRMGFRLLVMIKNDQNQNEIRHFGHSSMTVYNAFSALHDRFISRADEAKDPNRCPVLKIAKLNPIKGRMGTNYEPDFAIAKFADRPFEFDEYQPATAPVGATASTNGAPPTEGSADDEDLLF